MTTITTTASLGTTGGIAAAFRAFAAEAAALVQALANPGAVVREVERMRALQIEANRVEARDPLRAATLRRRAAQLCRP